MTPHFFRNVSFKGQYHFENDQVLLWKIWVQHHSDHKLWTPYMWPVPLDGCTPAFFVRDKNFQKVTNWSALVPEISWESTNSQDMTQDQRLLTSSEMSVLHASHVFFLCIMAITTLKKSYYEKSWSGTTRPMRDREKLKFSVSQKS